MLFSGISSSLYLCYSTNLSESVPAKKKVNAGKPKILNALRRKKKRLMSGRIKTMKTKIN